MTFSQILLEYQSYLELAQQSSYLKNIAVPGERLTFGDFTLRFLVDENMENYLSVYGWLKGLGFPESGKQFKEIITDPDGLSLIHI